jgi:SAM-dependent methyltransferase
MDLKKRHKIEKAFHDSWAQDIQLSEIDPRRSFEAPTSAENLQVMEWLGDPKGLKILDLGCGLGDAAAYFGLRGARVTAVDISPGMVKVARKLAAREGVSRRVKVSQALGEKLPFRNASFDVVYGNGVLHHLDTAVAAPEIARILKPGGRALFIEPLAYNPLIWVYRRLAAGVRTEAEEPMTYGKFRAMSAYFESYRRAETQLLTLLIFLWFFIIEREHPSKVRYWKKIVNEAERYQRAFGILRAMERALMTVLPLLRPLCWNVVVEFRRKARA